MKSYHLSKMYYVNLKDNFKTIMDGEALICF